MYFPPVTFLMTKPETIVNWIYIPRHTINLWGPKQMHYEVHEMSSWYPGAKVEKRWPFSPWYLRWHWHNDVQICMRMKEEERPSNLPNIKHLITPMYFSISTKQNGAPFLVMTFPRSHVCILGDVSKPQQALKKCSLSFWWRQIQ